LKRGQREKRKIVPSGPTRIVTRSKAKVNHLDGSSSSFKEVEGEEGNFLTVREETGDHQSFKYFLLKQNKYEVLERIPDFLE
jgi:hypothetical protein